jgi:hypothetical protein
VVGEEYVMILTKLLTKMGEVMGCDSVQELVTDINPTLYIKVHGKFHSIVCVDAADPDARLVLVASDDGCNTFEERRKADSTWRFTFENKMNPQATFEIVLQNENGQDSAEALAMGRLPDYVKDSMVWRMASVEHLG